MLILLSNQETFGLHLCAGHVSYLPLRWCKPLTQFTVTFEESTSAAHRNVRLMQMKPVSNI